MIDEILKGMGIVQERGSSHARNDEIRKAVDLKQDEAIIIFRADGCELIAKEEEPGPDGSTLLGPGLGQAIATINLWCNKGTAEHMAYHVQQLMIDTIDESEDMIARKFEIDPRATKN